MSSFPANSNPPLRLVYPSDSPLRRSSSGSPLVRQKAIETDRAYRRAAAARDVASEVRRAAVNPDLDPADPRWVLAMEARKSLDGAAINPQKRQRLLRLANRLGMRTFDANLVLAIVQDEARRGLLPERPDARAPGLLDRLRIIPRDQSDRNRPTKRLISGPSSGERMRVITAACASIVIAAALVCVAIRWLLHGG